jgi:hypothetical protein
VHDASLAYAEPPNGLSNSATNAEASYGQQSRVMPAEVRHDCREIAAGSSGIADAPSPFTSNHDILRLTARCAGRFSIRESKPS